MEEHGSASPRNRTLDANLKRRARKLATDSRVDPRTRSLIRYGLELKDQHLEQIVNRIEAGEMRIDHIRLIVIKVGFSAPLRSPFSRVSAILVRGVQETIRFSYIREPSGIY
jgi:hypothetical protein